MTHGCLRGPHAGQSSRALCGPHGCFRPSFDSYIPHGQWLVPVSTRACPHNTPLEPNLPLRAPIDLVKIWQRLGFFGSPRRRANRLNGKTLYGFDLPIHHFRFFSKPHTTHGCFAGLSRATTHGQGCRTFLTGVCAGRTRAIAHGCWRGPFAGRSSASRFLKPARAVAGAGFLHCSSV
jgi:hypothetical protein